ncbi:MAG: hypothetical protein LRZ98_00140 [Candidatus Pacebacteria bacterium]|nr:hypothetical protein [Candidatus Paceibacterota bacterium]
MIIVEIDKKIFEGDLKKISLPSEDGEIEIFPGHTSFLSPLKKGVIRYIDKNDEIKKIEIERGFIEVNKKEAVIIL